MKTVKVEWCENFIKALFKKKIPAGGGIYDGLFWRLAEEAGLYEPGTYGSPMSKALSNLVKVETVKDADGNFAFVVFKLK